MTVQTLRPDSTVAAGSFSAVGAASLNAATSDNSDASYAQSSTTLNSYMSLGLGTYALLSDQRVKLFRVRQRAQASANSTGSNIIINDSTTPGLGGLWTTTFADVQTTTIGTTTFGWTTPPRELTQAVIDGLRVQMAQTFTTGGSVLRVMELYLDLDVRARPVINSFTATPSGGAVTFAGTFTYGTNATAETVTVTVQVFDDQGVLIDTLTTQVSGTDFSAAAFSIPYTSSFGSFTASATVTASGFTASEPTFTSLASEASYSVTAAGVEPPVIECTTDQAAQTVTLSIEQADNVLPPSVNCLRIETFGTGALGNQASFSGSGSEAVTTADAAPLDLTGNITVVVWAQATDWTPAANRALFGKMPTALTSGYGAYVAPTGLLNFVIGNGSAARVMASTAPGLTDGTGYWLEFFYDNTAKTCRFRKSTDSLYTAIANLTWTTISTSSAHAGGSPAANTNTLQVGAINTTTQWIGTIGYMHVLDQLGTSVAQADFRYRPLGAGAFVDGSGNTWTPAGGVTVITGSAAIATVGAPRHASLWINNVLTTADLVYGATSVTISGDTVGVIPVNSVVPQLVVATTGGGASNVVLVAYPISSGGTTVVHNLNTTNLIVQARSTASQLQTELGVTLNGTNEIYVDGSFSQDVTVLVLAQVAAGAVCVPTDTHAVLAATQDQVFTHQFASQLTLTTFIRTSDNRESWVGVTLGVGEVVVDNDGGAGTIYVSGYLAVFDDPDAVRAEVRRDGELIPLDGLNGALVPPFGEGALVVVDRFPPRYREPTCAGDVDPVGPTYEVRFYGYIDGVVAYSQWSECTPPAVLASGTALVRHPTDGDLDVTPCVVAENWQRVRPFSSAQPADGGLEFVRTGTISGRDFTVSFELPDTESTLALDALLAAAYVWYAPLDAALPSLWLAPASPTPFAGLKHDGRPHSLTQTFIEVEAESVELPAAGPPSS